MKYWWSYAVGDREVVFHGFESRELASWKRDRMKGSPAANRVGMLARKLTSAQVRDAAATRFPGLKCTVTT